MFILLFGDHFFLKSKKTLLRYREDAQDLGPF